MSAVLSIALVTAGCAQTQRPAVTVVEHTQETNDRLRARNEAIARVAATGNFRRSVEGEYRRLMVEGELASPNLVKEFGRFVTQLEKETLESHTGSDQSRIFLAETLQKIGTTFTDSVTAKSVEAQNDMAVRTNFARWRAENREQLLRNVGGMKLEIVQIASKTVISIEATNTTTSRILKPWNQIVWGYEFGSNVGGRLPIGASLTDSFGNEYKLMSITPSFLGTEAGGIRPGQTVTFELRFGDAPLQNAKSVRLIIEPATLGQLAATIFELSPEAFYETQ
jgi:hypothetical protein